MKKTYYDDLNLEKNCSSKAIKDAFIKLSKQYHPDKNKNSDAKKKFIVINEAYSILGNAQKRKLYDKSLASQSYAEYNKNFTTL